MIIEYELWREGPDIDHFRHCVKFLGFCEGEFFNDAVKNWVNEKFLFKMDSPYLWNCRLFENEESARKRKPIVISIKTEEIPESEHDHYMDEGRRKNLYYDKVAARIGVLNDHSNIIDWEFFKTLLYQRRSVDYTAKKLYENQQILPVDAVKELSDA